MSKVRLLEQRQDKQLIFKKYASIIKSVTEQMFGYEERR